MNATPGDSESDSLKWLTFCDRVNNHGEDPYDTMREMGLDQHFFENVPMAEPVSSSEDIVGLPFVETVDERGESPVAQEIFTAPPTINIPDELRDEITDIEPESEQFSDRVRRIETSPTAQLFNRRIVNTPDAAPGNQEYDETTFHNLTGLWFPGSANERRTRNARAREIEIEFNTPIENNPYAGEDDVYLTGRSLTQYEDWRDREVQEGNIDMETETISVNNIPGGRRTLIPFSGFGPFSPRRGEGYVEMPDSFWRWYGSYRHGDENYFFNRFRRRNRTTGGSRKKNKKLSKKRKPKNSKKRKPKKSKKKTKKRGGAPQDQDEMADFRSSPSPTRLPTREEFTEFELKKEILYELMLTLEIFSPGEFIPRERIYEDEDEVTGFENTVNVNRRAAQIIRNMVDNNMVPAIIDRYIDGNVQKIRALGMLDLTPREWEGMPLDRKASVIRNLRFVALVPPFEEEA